MSIFERRLAVWLPRIEGRLDTLVNSIRPATIRTPVAHVVEGGGKRIRPFITLMACEAVGGHPSRALDAAAAVELLHTFTLVHDDIMDNAPLRRGRATVHTRWDVNTAVLAGDTIAALAAKALARAGGDLHHALARYAGAFVAVCEGQALDKEYEGAASITERQYLAMIELKTAAIIDMAAAVGACVANTPPRTVKALSKFGRNLGMAFQIHDDLLDITGDPRTIGKSLAGDIREGKKSFLFIAARARAKSAADTKLLTRYARERGFQSPRDIAALIECYKRLGVPELAAATSAEYTGAALKMLDRLSVSVARNTLESLAQWLMTRTR